MNNCSQEFMNDDKPRWDEHDYAAICMCGNSNWFGLHEPVKPFYSEGWKDKEVNLLREQADFLKYGHNPDGVDIETLYEVRPTY